MNARKFWVLVVMDLYAWLLRDLQARKWPSKRWKISLKMRLIAREF